MNRLISLTSGLRTLRLTSLSFITLLTAGLFLSGCGTTHEAPVVNAWQQSSNKASRYHVQSGDTIYSVAWSFGIDYRALAAANNLQPPYRLYAGQKLTMVAASQTPPRPGDAFPILADGKLPKVSRVQPLASLPSFQAKEQPVSSWRWPARGNVFNEFNTTLAGNKGIDISGRLGQPILAAAAGSVVYSGDGVRGYGNLIIIKHNNTYLSAYAHNDRNLVAIGQKVAKGQRIALMGNNDAGKTLLHFEIRKNGQPVNPMRYLR